MSGPRIPRAVEPGQLEHASPRLEHALSDATTEDEWQALVLDLARVGRWLAIHHRPGLTRRGGWSTATQGTGAKGFPDLVLAHADRAVVLFVELKSNKGRLETAQRQWIETLTAAGQRAYVWRPRDYRQVEAALLRGQVAP